MTNNTKIDIGAYTYEQLKGYFKKSAIDISDLSSSYDNLRNSINPRKLGKQIKLYDDAIGVFSNIYYCFHKIYVDEKVPSQKDEQRSFIEATQILLTRLQNQYNQLAYRQQRNIAYIALGFTVLLGFISIIISLFFNDFSLCLNNKI